MDERRIILFRNRLRPGVDADYDRRAEEVYRWVTQMPGFVSSKDFVAADGERLAVIEFSGPDELAAWRDHSGHRQAQAEGRARWYSEYLLQVCAVLKESRFVHRALALILAASPLLGCPDTTPTSVPTACTAHGAKCKTPAGPLGVCDTIPCAAGATGPCFKCMPQH
jgi:heme-degrading monooxygenase HmoA